MFVLFSSLAGRGTTEVDAAAVDASIASLRIASLPYDDNSHGDVRGLLVEALEMAAEFLRDDPTVPAAEGNATEPDPAALSEEAAAALPRKHCAFSGCRATFAPDGKLSAGEQLCQHLQRDPSHRAVLEAVIKRMPLCPESDDVKFFSAYCEVIATKTRRGAPLDTYSIDRRAVQKYHEACGDDQVYSLICISCARRYPHVQSFGQKMRYRGAEL